MSDATEVTVRPAREGERETAIGICDAAMLETDADDAAAVLVAVADGRVLGALVAHEAGTAAGASAEIDAVAVRPGRRGQGIGTALVEAALDRYGRVAAAFDADVRPFYERLGFDVERIDDQRYRGVRSDKRFD